MVAEKEQSPGAPIFAQGCQNGQHGRPEWGPPLQDQRIGPAFSYPSIRIEPGHGIHWVQEILAAGQEGVTTRVRPYLAGKEDLGILTLKGNE